MTSLDAPPEYPRSLSTRERRQLSEIYEEFRKRGDAPQCLREFIYEQLGRTLP